MPYKHLTEEVLVVQFLPIGLVKIARTVENAAFAGVELDIDLVAVKRLCRDTEAYREAARCNGAKGLAAQRAKRSKRHR